MQLRLTLALLWFSTALSSQALQYSSENAPSWVKLMYAANTDETINATIEAYNSYYKEHEFEKNHHTQYFKRWLRRHSRDVDGYYSGSKELKHIMKQRKHYIYNRELQKRNKSAQAAWEAVGPFDFDYGARMTSLVPGAAHVYTVEQSKSSGNISYAGTATAGVWKSVDRGANWSLVTADLMVNEVKALDIDRTNPNHVLFGSNGSLWRSTNGGSSWTEIILDNGGVEIVDIVQHRTSANIFFIASNKGLFRSDTGGASWTNIMPTPSFYDRILEIETHPTQSNIVYAVKVATSKTEFYKSINDGASFVQKTAGWPNPSTSGGGDQRRTEIAVTPAAPNKIYALAGGQANGGTGLYGFYVSDDAGESWNFKCCGTGPGGSAGITNKNILGYSSSGTTSGGQQYYDLALAVSETAPIQILAGGINIWRSTNDGASWSLNSGWTYSLGNTKYVHADIHDIGFYGNDLWVATDGGVFYSNDAGNKFQKRMYGIQGTDFKGFDIAFLDSDVMIGGTYHNSNLMKHGNMFDNGWVSTAIGSATGDNTRGFVNPGDPKVIYMDKSGVNGRAVVPSSRTQSLVHYPFEKQPNADYTIGASCNMAYDPRYYNHILTGVDDDLWKTEDNGATWTLVKSFGSGKIVSIDVCSTNPDVIYLVQHHGTLNNRTKVWKTTDGGRNWSDVGPSFSSYSEYSMQVQVSATNPDHAWIARLPPHGTSQPLDGQKVYVTTSGGNNWSNISSATLNDERITNILHQKGSNLLYVGTRRTVYVYNGTSWSTYNTNLPASTSSTRLVANYKDRVIVNGTNRGAFKVPFAANSTPIAIPAVDKNEVSGSGEVFQFTDLSIMASSGANLQWQFPGGEPEISSSSNPTVQYFNEGIYDVKLTVTDASGSHSLTVDDMIKVGNSTGVLPVEINSFYGEYIGNGAAKLEWETASEVNMDRYNILRSLDGSRFEQIGSVISQEGEENNYEMIDYDAGEGTVYYRLESIDLNGDRTLSEVIVIDIPRENRPELLLYPNPAARGVNVILKTTVGEEGKILLYNQYGLKVIETEYKKDLFISTKDLPPGYYPVKLVFRDKHIIQTLIIQ